MRLKIIFPILLIAFLLLCSLCFLTVKAQSPTPTPQTYNTAQGIDLIIFILINGGLLGALIVAIEYYWFVGPIAGLFGAIFSLEIFREGQNLILRTFINAQGELIYQTMPMGYLFYVPIILSLLCIVAPIIKRLA